MPVHAEAVRDIIRLRCGPDFRCYGDPWTFRVDVEIKDGYTAYLAGGCGKSYPGMRREIKEKLKEMGFTKVEWERRRNGGVKKVEDAI